MQQLLTTQQVCEILRLSRSALHEGVMAGTVLPPVKLGRLNRWKSAELLAWIAADCPNPKKWKDERQRDAAEATA